MYFFYYPLFINDESQYTQYLPLFIGTILTGLLSFIPYHLCNNLSIVGLFPALSSKVLGALSVSSVSFLNVSLPI